MSIKLHYYLNTPYHFRRHVFSAKKPPQRSAGAFSGLRLCRIPAQERRAEAEVYDYRNDDVQAVGGDLGPDKPVHTDEVVQQVQHGDIESQPAHRSQQQRDIALSKSLEQIHRKKAHEHKRRCKHTRAQERRRRPDRLRIVQKQPYERRRKQLVQQDTHSRYHKP